jgi:type IV secretory pathway TrbD component
MIYGAYGELIGKFSSFGGDGIEKFIIIDEAETQANLIKIRLRKLFESLPVQAGASIVASSNVSDADEVAAGSDTYIFKTTPAAAYDVKVGATTAISMANLNSAIAEAETGEYYTGTKINSTVESTRSDVTLNLKARKCGLGGNDLTLSTTSGVLSIVAFSGGQDEVPALKSLNIWMTAHSLLTGRAVSADSGGQSTPLMERLKGQIDFAWTTLEKASGLVTVTGDVLNAKSVSPVYAAEEEDD